MVSRRGFLKTSAACLVVPAVMGVSGALWGQSPTLRVRKNLMSLADDDLFFEQYGEAVKVMHALPTTDLRSWWGQATIHANYCQHGTLNFVSWHRPYITLFEEIAGALIQDPSFTLHYWDWSQKGGIIPNPFYNNPLLDVTYWKDSGEYDGINWGPINSLPIRALGKGQGLGDDPRSRGAFDADSLQTILRQSDFANFSNLLERQPHNTGHVISGFGSSGPPGHIGDGLSPLDPVFWMHHCMVDFMWAKWQAAGNQTQDKDETYADMFVDKDGNPITFTSTGVRDFVNLGFTYDGIQAAGDFDKLLQAAEISDEYQARLADQIKSAEPVSLGATQKTVTAEVGKAVSLSAKTSDLLKALQGSRVFRTHAFAKSRLAFENQRILAVLKNVGWPEGDSSGLVVNAFVNCPYLTPDTPTSDPNYAGTFSFFGSPKMAAMGHGNSVVIDITAPLRNQAAAGRLDDDINVQLMPLNASVESRNKATFKVADLEIIAI